MKDAEPLDEVRRAVTAADGPLDEVARARVQARLLAALEEAPVPAREPRPARRWRPWWVVACAVAGGAAAAVLGARALLRPAPAPAASAAASSFTRLEVPAGARVRTSLGDRAHITLAGPAELELVSASAELLEIRLPRGVLIGDYDHRAGGTLRIQSPGATTDVVGTLFAVEASAQGSRVSVTHGRVQVRAPGLVLAEVNGGQSWSSGAPAVAAIAPETERLIAERDAIGVMDAPRAAPPAPPEPAPAPPAAPPAVATPAPAAEPALVEAPRPTPDERPAATPAAARPPLPRALPSAERSSAPAAALAPGPARPPAPLALPAAPPPATAPPLAPPPTSAPPLPATAPPLPATAPPPGDLPPPATRTDEADVRALYATAEAAMQSGDLAAARATLERLVRAAPGSRLADPGRYELARLALKAGDHVLAARALDELIGGGRDESLREPARFLRCRVELAAGRRTSGSDCLARFLRDFPASPHAATARRLLGRPSP